MASAAPAAQAALKALEDLSQIAFYPTGEPGRLVSPGRLPSPPGQLLRPQWASPSIPSTSINRGVRLEPNDNLPNHKPYSPLRGALSSPKPLISPKKVPSTWRDAFINAGGGEPILFQPPSSPPGASPNPKRSPSPKSSLIAKAKQQAAKHAKSMPKTRSLPELSRGSTSPSGRSGSPGRENRSPTREASSQRVVTPSRGVHPMTPPPQFGASMSLDGLNSSGGLGFSPATPGGGGFMSGSKKKGPNRRPSLSSWGVGP